MIYAFQGLAVTASKSSASSSFMVMNMRTRRSLPILVLTLALVMGSVAIAHAPPPSQPPVIGTPIISPTAPTSGNIVTVSVNVTSARSTVKNVTMTYTTDNWKSTNTTIVSTYNSTTTPATGKLTAVVSGAHVEYYIVAFDNAGNSNLNNTNRSYFPYDVSAPTSLTSVSTLTYILVAAGTTAAAERGASHIAHRPHT